MIWRVLSSRDEIQNAINPSSEARHVLTKSQRFPSSSPDSLTQLPEL
jgi:hypothetical protein